MATLIQVETVIETILFETDVPHLVLSRDAVGGTYLCSLVDVDDGGDRFLAIEISADRISELKAGKRDLRSVMLSPEMRRHYEGRSSFADDAPTITLVELDGSPPEAWLPEDGLLLSEFLEGAEDEKLVREAHAANAAVVACHLDPPRSKAGHVDAKLLAGWLEAFQDLVRSALTRLGPDGGHLWSRLRPEDSILEVTAFSTGSFGIHFESKERPDLYGESYVGLAMSRIDTLMATLEMSPDKALAVASQNSGHILSAYKDLLKFVEEQNTPVSYRWAQPAMARSKGYNMSPAAARSLRATLESTEELDREPRELQGHFVKVDTVNGSWAIRAAQGKPFNGRVHDDASPDVLQGVVIGTKPYRLNCVEIREREVTTGKVKFKIYLLSTTSL